MLMLSFNDLTVCGIIFLLTVGMMEIITNKQNFIKRYIPHYIAPQKIHKGEVSRLGGLAMIVSLATLFILLAEQEIKNMMLLFLVAFLPLGLITLAEDFHKVIAPWIRLIVMFFSSCLILVITDISLPLFDTPFLKSMLADPLLRNIFYMFCLVTLMNGINFVDGTNGNFALMILSMMISLCFLATIVGDTQFIILLFLSGIPLIAFTLLNYPWGRIFAGDLGAYLYGALTGFFILFFFGRHSDISAWNVLLITFYPIIEVIFSSIRKLLKGKSPMLPDTSHLHIKIYTMLYHGSKKPRQANNLVTLFLGLFWLFPTLILPWVYQSHILLAITLTFLTFCYVTINVVITKIE